MNKKPSSAKRFQSHRTSAWGSSVQWLASGWRLFQKAPGGLIGVSVVYLITLAVIGFLGNVALRIVTMGGANMLPVDEVIQAALVVPSVVLAGGFLVIIANVARGGEVQFAKLFSCFSTHLKPLLALGAVFGMVSLATQVLIYGSMAPLGFGGAGRSAILESVLWFGGFLGYVILALSIVVAGCASVLVVLANQGAGLALRHALGGFRNNPLTFLFFSWLASMVIAVGAIPSLLGLPVAIPVVFASIYALSEDVHRGIFDEL